MNLIYLNHLVYLVNLLAVVGIRKVLTKRSLWRLNAGLCPPALCGPEPTLPGGEKAGSKREFPFFEGDIVLESELKDRTKRAIVKEERKLWLNGIIPYEVDVTLNRRAKAAIRKTITYFQNKTCIRFRTKRKEDMDYIKYVNQPGCWSFIGVKGGMQLLSVGPYCEDLGIVIHETGHALGFWHEQSRSDRDRFVKIVWENISPRYFSQFGKREQNESDSRAYAYDYQSVMHYGSRDFSNNAKKTIHIKGVGRKFKFKIGQRKGLSNLDIAQLRDMYNCNINHKDTLSCIKTKYKNASDYRGTLDYTEEGITCQYWTEQYPQRHKRVNQTRDGVYGLGDHNYCRNPAGKRLRPWCFTTKEKVKWQYCKIVVC